MIDIIQHGVTLVNGETLLSGSEREQAQQLAAMGLSSDGKDGAIARQILAASPAMPTSCRSDSIP